MYLSVLLFVAVVVGVLIIVFVTKTIGGKSAKFFMAQQQAVGKMEGYVEEVMHGQKVVKVFCHEKESVEKMHQINGHLFEVSNKEVWEKAIKDTDGLTKFFKQNKKNYTWNEPRYKGFVVKCKDEATAKSLKKAIKKMNPDSVSNYIRTQVNNDSVTFASVERGLWKQNENSYVDLTEFKVENAQIETNEELPIVIIVGKMLKKPETYTDVRGTITADYQNHLEKLWIENLRNKYAVEINQEVLNSLR
jgi:hypothetical protein